MVATATELQRDNFFSITRIISYRFGIYPITAFALSQPPPAKTRAVSPENQSDSDKQGDKKESTQTTETRRVAQMLASIGETDTKGVYNFIVIARLEDCMNRQMTCQITVDDGPDILANELIEHNFICPVRINLQSYRCAFC